MRALIVLLALVATPYVAGVSQGRPGQHGQSGQHGQKNDRAVRKSSTRPSSERTARTDAGDCDQQGQHEGSDEGCGSAPPPPPPPPPPPTGGEIHGSVWLDANMDGVRDPAEVGVPNWSILLNGAIATVTDAAGNYALTGLAAGTYEVCQVTAFNWFQTFPTTGNGCGGFGYLITLSQGQVVTGKDFADFN